MIRRLARRAHAPAPDRLRRAVPIDDPGEQGPRFGHLRRAEGSGQLGVELGAQSPGGLDGDLARVGEPQVPGPGVAGSRDADEQSACGSHRGAWPRAGRCGGARPLHDQAASGSSDPAAHSRAYTPPAASSSAWVPSSTIRPSASTAMRSARAAVASRWATTNAVRRAST